MTAPSDSLREIQALLERGGVDSATWFALREKFDELSKREETPAAPRNLTERERA